MPLAPDVKRLLDAMARQPAPQAEAVDPAEMRRAFAEGWQRSGPFEPVGDVYDRTIPGPGGDIPVRVYVPDSPASSRGEFPVFVWFHGGGWVIGSLDDNEAACRAVCRGAGAVVMSVDYRLAPENPFPAAAEDAYAAARWAAEHAAEMGGGPGHVAVGGESAGGNLAAACALMARDRGGPEVALQLLVSPVMGRPDDGRPSYAEYAEGYFQTAASMEFFFEQYPAGPQDLANPYLLPLAADDLAGVAPALVMTAECEVLRDEGEEYGRRLQEAGVPCDVVRYDGQVHGFFGLLDEHLSISAVAHDRAAQALLGAFGAAADVG